MTDNYSLEADSKTHPTPDPATVSAYITELIQKAGGPLSGTTIAAAIRTEYPGFSFQDHGVAKLREFIQKFASGTKIVGRQGMDILVDLRDGPMANRSEEGYSSNTEGRGVSASGGPAIFEETNVWRAFTSPNSSSAVKIEVERLTGAWRSVAPDTPAQPGWVSVTPLSDANHREIVAKFLTTQDQEVCDLMQTPLRKESTDWWKDLRGVLRTRPNLAEDFARFRLSEIRSTLKTTLAMNGLESGAIEAAVEKATSRAHRVRKARENESGTSLKQVAQEPLADSFKDFVLKVLSRVPEHELREIRVRLGDVYSALH